MSKEAKVMSAGSLPHCGECGNTGPIYLHGRCHPQSPTWTKIDGGIAIVECAECKQEIARLRLAVN